MNSSGWCRGPVNTNMRICTGKGSVVVVDALNGDNAVRWGVEQRRLLLLHGPEEPLSIRQEKDMRWSVFCTSKGYGALGHAHRRGLHLAQLVEH